MDRPQSPDGPRAKPGLQQYGGGGQVVRAPMADTGHSRVQLTQSGGHLCRPCSPPAPLTGQAQPHSQRQGYGQDGTGIGDGGRQAPRSECRGWAAVSSWSGLLRFQAAATPMSSKPLTDVCLGRMQTVQHGQAQTQGDRGDTEHGTRNGNKAGAMDPWRVAWFPQPGWAGQEK